MTIYDKEVIIYLKYESNYLCMSVNKHCTNNLYIIDYMHTGDNFTSPRLVLCCLHVVGCNFPPEQASCYRSRHR